jgi:hypothetical protein
MAVAPVHWPEREEDLTDFVQRNIFIASHQNLC